MPDDARIIFSNFIVSSSYEDDYDDYDEDDYDCDQDEQGVDEYGSNDRGRLFKNCDLKNPLIMGIEMETLLKCDYDDVASVGNHAASLMGGFAERDGSLDDCYGIEFIFPPLTLDQITPDGPIGKWHAYLKGKATAWDAGRGYGMHISVNAGAMSQLHCCRFCLFINSNPDFCQKISGRGDEWAEYADYPLRRYREETNKYLAASRRSKTRIEVRIFRASLKWERIRRNCEFIESLLVWTKRCRVKNLNVANYIDFLKDKDRYKNIYDFVAYNTEAVGE